MIVFFFAGLGLIIGSFLNVVVLRHGASSLGGRSACMSCGTMIRWYDNIPLISWLLLRGRCRTCGSRISIQYPLVEGTTGLLFALLGYSALRGSITSPLPLIQLVDALVALSLLVVIAVYDLRHTIIPDRWAYLFAAAAFIYPVLGAPAVLAHPTWFLLGGPVAALPLFALWGVSRGKWMGFGDVKLALGIGWLLGPLYGVFAVFLAFVIGASVGVPLLVLSSASWKRFVSRFTPTLASPKRVSGFTMKSEIPFGPFLVASCIIVWLSIMYGIEPLSALGLIPGSL